MNSSYHVDTSYKISGKLTIIIIIVAIVIALAVVVSVIKLIKTKTANMKNKKIEEEKTEVNETEEETYEEPVVSENLVEEDEGYEAPNFNDINPQINNFTQNQTFQSGQVPPINSNIDMAPVMPQVQPNSMPNMNVQNPEVGVQPMPLEQPVASQVNVTEPQTFMASIPQAQEEQVISSAPMPDVAGSPLVNNEGQIPQETNENIQ